MKKIKSKALIDKCLPAVIFDTATFPLDGRTSI